MKPQPHKYRRRAYFTSYDNARPFVLMIMIKTDEYQGRFLANGGFMFSW